MKGVVAVAGGVVTIAAAVTLIVTTVRDVNEPEPPTQSQRLERLQAGMTFARFRSTLAETADVQRPVEAPDSDVLEGRRPRRYVFVSPDAYVQAVVAEGTVLGFSIVARTAALRPAFSWPTAGAAATLGESRFAEFEPQSVGGFCGANRAQYFESHGGSGADNTQSFALGVSSIGAGGDEVFNAVCAASRPLFACGADGAYINVIFAPDAAPCFLRRPRARALRDRAINAYVETAPGVPLFSELLAPLEPELVGID